MYKEVLHNISIFEKEEIKEPGSHQNTGKENSRLSDELKKLYNLKNQFEKLTEGSKSDYH